MLNSNNCLESDSVSKLLSFQTAMNSYQFLISCQKVSIQFRFQPYRWKDHVREVDKWLGVEPPVDGQANGRQEEQVAEAEEEGRGEEVNLGGGLAVVGATPAFVTWEQRAWRWPNSGDNLSKPLACTIKLFMAVIWQNCNKLKCLPLSGTSAQV